jgi:hypothetical protein
MDMAEKHDLTARLAARLASKSSRRGFLGFAGATAVGLGVGLHGASLAWAQSCIDCGTAVCGCSGACCLYYSDTSCSDIGYPCSDFGCNSNCTQQSWTCCYASCRWICAECCCNQGTEGCSCAIQGTVSCGGGNCNFAPSKAA